MRRRTALVPFGSSCFEDLVAKLPGPVVSCSPQGGLADAGFALEEQARGAAIDVLDERGDLLELPLTTDQRH